MTTCAVCGHAANYHPEVNRSFLDGKWYNGTGFCQACLEREMLLGLTVGERFKAKAHRYKPDYPTVRVEGGPVLIRRGR